MTALTLLTDTLQLIAATDPKPAEGEVKPGPMMAVVVLGIVAASVFLWFSLRKQLGRIQVPREGEDGGPGGSAGAAEESKPEGPPPVS